MPGEDAFPENSSESLSKDASEAGGEPEGEGLWSRIPQRGLAGFAFRLALYAAISAGAYFFFGSVSEAIQAALGALSAEAGFLALVGYLRASYRRKLPEKIDALELLEVQAPEDLAAKRKGGIHGKLARAHVVCVVCGVLGVVMLALPFVPIAMGIQPEELPEPISQNARQVSTTLMMSLLGFAGGFWPSEEKEQVKEALQREEADEGVS